MKSLINVILMTTRSSVELASAYRVILQKVNRWQALTSYPFIFRQPGKPLSK